MSNSPAEQAKAYAAALRRERAAETLRAMTGAPMESDKIRVWATAIAAAMLTPPKEKE